MTTSYKPMFTATFVTPYSHPAGLTVGKEYEVLNFDDWSGTYTIVNDNGNISNVGWDRFADQGRASTEYQRNTEI